MEIEKLNQVEVRRIERYIQEMVDKKIRDLEADKEERERAEAEVKANPVLKQLAEDYKQIKGKIESAEKKYSVNFAAYREYFELPYTWEPKDKANLNKKIEKVKQAHKDFTETLIFKGKPEILKAIKAIEAI